MNTGTHERLRAVTYANGQFITVGNKGSILSSKDGEHWTFQANDSVLNFADVTYGNGYFLAVTDEGSYTKSQVYTSMDGGNWEKQETDATHNFQKVVFGNGAFVATAWKAKAFAVDPTQSGIAVSSDGRNWRFIQLGWTFGLTYAQNKFVVSGADFSLWTSSDGSTWTANQSFTTPTFQNIAFGGTRFVGVGAENRSTSPDAITWTLGGYPATPSTAALAYGNGTFVAAGRASSHIFVSPDGITWIDTKNYPPSDIFDLTFADGKFVAVGETGLIQTSVDGLKWVTRQPGNFISNVAYGNGIFVGLSLGNIVISSDGVVWTQITTESNNQLLDIVYANGEFVTVGAGGIVLTSSDGRAWQSQTRVTTTDLLAVTYGNKRFLSTGANGDVAISLDGKTWKRAQVGRKDALHSVAFGNGIFLALGSTAFLTSPDGLVWSAISQGVVTLLDVSFGKGAFVMVGLAGSITATGDGEAVQPVRDSTFGTPANLNSSIFVNGSFWAVGDQGTILSSPNAVTWTVAAVTNKSNFSDLTFGKGIYLAVSRDGVALLLGEIEAAPPRFTSIRNSSPVRVTLNIEGFRGRDVEIYASSDLVSWRLLATLANPTGVIEFLDLLPEGTRARFYRANDL